MNVVINFDFPKLGETYLHRIGRSGKSLYWLLLFSCAASFFAKICYRPKNSHDKTIIFNHVLIIQAVLDTWGSPSTSSLTMTASTWKGSRSSLERRSSPSLASLTRAYMWQSTTVRVVKKSSHEPVSTQRSKYFFKGNQGWFLYFVIFQFPHTDQDINYIQFSSFIDYL